ncbi:bestrophin-like domain [Streptomyces sp. NPDC002851]
MSNWLVLGLAMAAAVAVVVFTALVRDRRARNNDTSETPDVIEYMTMMIGVVYAIVLGLAIAGVWEGRAAAEDTARAEAFALHELRERASDFPAATADRIRSGVDAYVHHAVAKEWPVYTETGELTARGDRLLTDVRRTILAHQPRTDGESRASYALTDQLTAAAEARNTRSLESGSTLGPLVWFGLVTGGLVSIGMLFALQLRRSARELVLAGVFTSLIAFLLFLVWQFDSPVARDVEGLTEPFTALFPQAAGG